jgi:hypothetical protein
MLKPVILGRSPNNYIALSRITVLIYSAEYNATIVLCTELVRLNPNVIFVISGHEMPVWSHYLKNYSRITRKIVMGPNHTCTMEEYQAATVVEYLREFSLQIQEIPLVHHSLPFQGGELAK